MAEKNDDGTSPTPQTLIINIGPSFTIPSTLGCRIALWLHPVRGGLLTFHGLGAIAAAALFSTHIMAFILALHKKNRALDFGYLASHFHAPTPTSNIFV